MGIYAKAVDLGNKIPGPAGVAIGIGGLVLSSAAAYLAGAVFSGGIGKLMGVK